PRDEGSSPARGGPIAAPACFTEVQPRIRAERDRRPEPRRSPRASHRVRKDSWSLCEGRGGGRALHPEVHVARPARSPALPQPRNLRAHPMGDRDGGTVVGAQAPPPPRPALSLAQLHLPRIGASLRPVPTGEPGLGPDSSARHVFSLVVEPPWTAR